VVFIAAGSRADSGAGLAERVDSTSVCFAAIISMIIGCYPTVMRSSLKQDHVEVVTANTVVDMVGFGSAD
jgi:hypothetical protein